MKSLNLALLIVASNLIQTSVSWTEGGCHVEDVPGSVFFLTGGYYDAENMDGELCKASCTLTGNENITLAGITGGNVCLCGKESPGILNAAPALLPCDFICQSPTGAPGNCGGLHGAFSVYGTSGIQFEESLSFTLHVDRGTDSVKLENILIGNDPSKKVFAFLKKSPNSFPMPVGDGLEKDQTELNSYFASSPIKYTSFQEGPNVIELVARTLNSNNFFGHQEVLEVHKYDQRPISVQCPELVVPDEEHFCTLNSHGTELDNLELITATVTHPSVTSTLVLNATDMEYVNIGGPMPTHLSSSGDLSGILIPPSSLAPSIIIRNSINTDPLQISMLEWWGDPSSSNIAIEIFEPKCEGLPFDTRSGYCQSNGLDFSQSYFDPFDLYSDKCESGKVFVSPFESCLQPHCSATSENCKSSTLRDVPDSFVPVAGPITFTSTFSSANYHQVVLDVSSDILRLEAGQALGISGARVGYLSSSLEADFLPDGSSADGKYLFAIEAFRTRYVNVSLMCSKSMDTISLELKNADGSISATNTTICETPIDGLTGQLNETFTPQKAEWNPVVVVIPGETVNLTLATLIGNPISYSVNWNDSTPLSTLENSNDDRSVQFTHAFSDPGLYSIYVEAKNRHSIERFGFVSNLTLEARVLVPVGNWTFQAEIFHISDDEDFFMWLLYSPDVNVHLPSDPSISCNWGDGTENDPDGQNFDMTNINTTNPSYRSKHVTHNYTEHGEFSFWCRIFNELDEITLESNVTVHSRIKGLSVMSRYGTEFGHLLEGNGDLKNVFPLDASITFLFSVDQGTVEQIELILFHEDNTNLTLGSFNVTDIYDVNSYNITITSLTESGIYNISFVARNSFDESAPIFVSVAKFGSVKEISLDDRQVVTSVEETKWFYVDFQELGSDTCIHLDFNDGMQRTYGNQDFCEEWKPLVSYEEGLNMELPLEIPHIYYLSGVYVVTASASNSLTNGSVSTNLTIVVFTGACQPPYVRIKAKSDSFSRPTIHRRSDAINLETFTFLNCSGILTSMKRWEVHKVHLDANHEKIEHLERLDAQTLAPSYHNFSSFRLQPRSLGYGLYKITHYVRSWDLDDNDYFRTRIYPFEGSDFTYLEILATPLVARMIEGSADFITRGTDQTLTLEPYLFSFDPDFPEDRSGLSFRYFCRQVGENFTLSENGVSVAYDPPGEIPFSRGNGKNGTCFGTGYHALNYTLPYLTLRTNVFIESDMTYVIRLEVSKGDRMSFKELTLMLVDGKPPVMEVQCSDPNLCLLDSSGQYSINPHNRLALRSQCSFQDGSDCSEPMSYHWIVYFANGTEIEEDFISSGNSDSQVAFTIDLYSSVQTSFQVGLVATNANQKQGISKISLNVNQPPEGGTCEVSPSQGVSLLDIFQFSCQDWIDPEDVGIKQYIIRTTNLNDLSTKTLTSIPQASIKDPVDLDLAVGIYTFEIIIEDLRGATTIYSLPNSTLVDEPPPEVLFSIANSNYLENLAESGNSEDLMMAIQSQFQLINEAEILLLEEHSLLPLEELHEDELLDKISVQKGELQLMAMEALKSGTPPEVLDLATAEMMAYTVESIVGKATENGQPSSVGLELTEAATDYIDNLLQSVLNLPTGDSSSLLNVVTSSLNTLGYVYEESLKTAVLDNDYSSDDEYAAGSGSGMCSDLKPIDVEHSDSSSFLYETFIDSIDMEIPSDPAQRRCGGIIDAARSTTGLSGEKMYKLLPKVAKAFLERSVLDEENIIQTGPITLYSKMTRGSELSEWHTVGYDDEKDPKWAFVKNWCLGPLENGTTCKTNAGIAAVAYNRNPLCHVPTCDRLAYDTKVLDMHVTNTDNELLELGDIFDLKGREGLLLDIPRTNYSGIGIPDPHFYNATLHGNLKKLKYLSHQISVEKADPGVVIEFYPEDLTVDFLLLLSFDKIPTYKNYLLGSMATELDWNSDRESYEWYLDVSVIKNRTGFWYLTVMTLTQPLSQHNLTNGTAIPLELVTNFTSNYALRTWSTGCYFYHEQQKAWIADGMSDRGAIYSRTDCRSSHNTAFAAGFFIIPNTISFDYVFANASFQDNLTIYLTILFTLTLYLILMIWAKIHDMKDERKLVSRLMIDNNQDHKYMYEILAITGNHHSASCQSKVQLTITGEHYQTATRCLDPGWKETLRKGCVDSYIMKVPRPLGKLNYVRVWHDNTGRGNYASWHCSAIIIRDLQTNQKFEFVLNNWLASEKGDGKIDRLISCSGSSQKSQFNFQFGYLGEKSLRESHLWFSIFMRNERSRFTRCQRVSTCMALLYLAMLADAMWYETVPESVPDGFKLGPLVISLEQILVGIMCNLITFPAAFLIIFMFKKSKRRVLRPNRQRMAIESEPKGEKDRENVAAESSSVIGELALQSESERIPGRKRRITLHWIFKYLAWILCFGCICTSIFFLWLYAVQFGNDKTYQWLTSMIFSFFSGILLIEPIKVFLLAMFMTCICKDYDLDDDEVEQDEESNLIYPKDEWFKEDPSAEQPTNLPLGVHPIDEQMLDVIREARKKEMEMWSIVRELAGYFFFIMIVYIISYGNRDPKSFLLQTAIRRNFIDKHGFNKIVTANDWWDWAHRALIPELRAQHLYNGQPPYGLRGFVGDHTNRMMGYAVLRQVRVVPNSCRVDPRVHSITQECAHASAFINEDHNDYCNAWEEQNELTENLPSCQKPEFKYTTAKELESLPYTAKLDLYGGGGYVYRLSGPQVDIKEELLDLQRQHWLNNHTRAVFLEFSVYNAQVNLFGICTIIAEFVPGGGILPYWRIEPVRLLHHHEPEGKFIMLCEVMFVCYIIYFIVDQFIEMRKQKKRYWKTYWVLAEWGVIIFSIAAISLYAFRYILTSSILDTFVQTKGNGYIKLQYVGVIDEFYGYSIGLILFVGTIKFIKLLRFNNRFKILILTLKVCWEDLSGFVSVFFLVFFAFVQVFYMILHIYMLEFSTIIAALETCFTMLLNKFKFGGIRENSLTAAVMFFCFAISCSFVLINVLLTIIIEAFEKMKTELNEQGNEYDILEFLFRHAKALIGIESLPPTISALKEDMAKNDKRKESLVDRKIRFSDPNHKDVDELPEKIDLFVKYINNLYLEGALDDVIDGKELQLMMKAEQGANLKMVYNGSDGSGTSNSPTKPNLDADIFF